MCLQLEISDLALAGVAQWVEPGPENRRIAGSIPGRAHAWVAGWVPSRGRLRGSQHIDVPSFSLLLSLKINK